MSADNWEVCPRCFDKAKAEYQQQYKAVMGSYGSVPVDEFDAARAALKEPDPEDYRTLREDYEFYGAEEGEVQATYECGCSKCLLTAELKTSKRFYERASR